MNNEYTLKDLGLEGGACQHCDCHKCVKTCTECDWIGVNGPINCHEKGVKGCPYIPQKSQSTPGYSIADKMVYAKKQAKEFVYINMSKGDIEENCQSRGIQVTKDRFKMESELIEALAKEIVELP